MAKEIEKYIQRSKRIIENSPRLDEANTKKKIVEPLIELLGWNMYSSDVELEYPIQMGSTQKKVDYALISDGTPVVFIEAKGCDTEISDLDVSQLKSYMKQEDVMFGLITNGKKFRIFKMNWEKQKSRIKELSNFSLKELKNERLNKILSQKSIKTGESERIAEKIENSRKAIEKLDEKKDELIESIVETISQNIDGLSASKIENEAAKFIDELSSTLKEPVMEQVKTEERKVPEVSRQELREYNDGKVILCPSNPDGINFLLQYNAWGFITVGKKPEYLAIYLTEPEGEIRYIGEVKKIVDPEKEKSPVPNYKEYEHYSKGKKILILKEGSLKKLRKPIPRGKNKVLYSKRYSSLNELKSAETLDDII